MPHLDKCAGRIEVLDHLGGQVFFGAGCALGTKASQKGRAGGCSRVQLDMQVGAVHLAAHALGTAHQHSPVDMVDRVRRRPCSKLVGCGAAANVQAWDRAAMSGEQSTSAVQHCRL